MTAAGVAIFATSPVTRDWRSAERHHSWLGPLTSRRVRVLLACIAIASLGTGICQVAIPAIGVRAGSQASAGVLLGVWSIGSMLGAVAFGAIHWRIPIEGRYRVLYLLIAAATCRSIGARSIPAGMVFAFVCGLPLARLDQLPVHARLGRRARGNADGSVRLERGRGFGASRSVPHPAAGGSSNSAWPAVRRRGRSGTRRGRARDRDSPALTHETGRRGPTGGPLQG